MSRPNSSHETLERMLNKTTLTLQRVTHRDIIEHGQKAFVQTTTEESFDKEKAVQIALEQAEARFARELKSMLDRLRTEKENERIEALRAQKSYYDKHLAHVSKQRDLLEEERLRELRRQFDMEKETALVTQETRLRAEAEAVLEEVRRTERGRAEEQLRAEHQCEIAAAIRKTEVACKREEDLAVEEMRLAGVREAQRQVNALTKVHEAALAKEAERYQSLLRELQRVLTFNREIEADFLLMQTDYKRFLDHTDGQFHSDYMLKLRRHGLKLANLELPKLELEDLSESQLQALAEGEQ